MAGEHCKPLTTKLFEPPLTETAEFLQQSFKAGHFEHATVEVVDCPDLREKPIGLVSAGLGGNSRILQLGGVSWLFPNVITDKVYDLRKVAEACELPGYTMLGAGGGPFGKLGIHSEGIVNFQSADNSKGQAAVCGSYVTHWRDDGSYTCRQDDEPQASFICDMFASEGKQDKVLHFSLKKRTSEKAANVFDLIRGLLIERFGADRSIGMGGVLLLKSGKVRVHILRPQIKSPMTEITDLFHRTELPAPLVGLGMLVTNDCGIQMNHSHVHFFSHEVHGGHYEHDVTPDEVEYEAYLSFASGAIHFDPPK